MKNSILLLAAVFMTCIAAQGQVFITELADPNDAAGCRYIELYNAGASEVDLSTGWALQRFTNANSEPQSPVSLSGTIPAGSTYVIAASSSSFTSCFGFAPDEEIGSGGPADSNGDDNVQLLDPSEAVVDIFGLGGEDGSGTCHEFEDGRAERAAGVTAGNGGTWDESNWNVWADSEVTGCTNHVNLPVNTTDGLFDPGSWIGGVSSASTAVAFSSFEYSVAEDGNSIDVCASIENADDNNATTVDVTLDASGTATNGDDFNDGEASPSAISFPITLTFPAGDNSDQCFTIFINDDSETEGDETIVLGLENVSGGDEAGLTAPAQTTVTILDNDFAATPDVVISEIMYNTPGFDDEWIEICNLTGDVQSLDDYTVNVGGDVEFTFGPDSDIAPSSCITVSLGSDGDGIYNNDCDFVPDYGVDASTDNTNNLVNSSTTIAIVAPDGLSFADEVTYNDSNGADGNGSTLHVIDASQDNSNTGSNWQEVADGGSPGTLDLTSPCTVTETIVEFSDAVATVSEEGGEISVCATIENPDSENATTVDVSLDGASTASNGADYDDGAGSPVSFPQTLTFPAGDNSSQCVSFTIIDDMDVEDNETVVLNLENISGGNNAMLGGVDQAEVTIVDNDSDVDADIVINEIHYNPCSAQGNDGDFEFLELYNNGDTEIDLTGWSLANAVTTTFGDASIAAGEYVVVAVNSASYEGNGYQVFSFSGSLNNSGETIELYDASNNLMDQVAYSSGSPWPGAANGDCPSLELIDASSDNNDVANWQASFVANGTPGAVNSEAPDVTAYTIVELQSEDHSEEFVSTSGVVTGVFGSDFTIQDGSGAFSGIWVSGSGVTLGDQVTIEGTVQEAFDLTVITASSITVDSSGNTLPAAEELATGDVSQEMWEGVLVQVTAEVDNEDLGFGEWSLNDGSGAVAVDDLGFDAQPVELGATYQVTGPLYYSFDAFKITPRDEADVAKFGCTNEEADNYDPDADIDDDSCIIDGEILGCTYENASNYDPEATDDDGSCEFILANDCPTDIDGNGMTGTTDLLLLLGNFGANCP